jgi:hypothetical protein
LPFIRKSRGRYSRKPQPVSAGSQPVYNAATDKLIFRDDFNNYASINSTAPAFTTRYPQYRTLDVNQQGFDDGIENFVFLVTGKDGVGQALSLEYGTGFAGDIIVGTQGRLNSIGQWDGTLPERAGPYTHFYFTTDIRFTGADPASGTGGASFAGVKGIMFWNSNVNNRYESAVNRVDQLPSTTTRYLKGSNPQNSQTPGFTLYKTADGKALPGSTVADGNWHNVTYEFYAGNDPSGNFGWTEWFDGVLIYSDKNIDVSGAPVSHYDYSFPITHHMVFGNFPNAGDQSAHFSVQFDNWSAWTN